MIYKFINPRINKHIKNILNSYYLFQESFKAYSSSFSFISDENFDRDYYLNKDNQEEIISNIKLRKLKSLLTLFEPCKSSDDIANVLDKNIHLLPNKLDPKWTSSGINLNKPLNEFVIDERGSKIFYPFVPKKCDNIVRSLGLLNISKFDNIGLAGGQRSYVMVGDLVRLQQAIIDWTVDELIEKFNFTLILVPNLVYASVIQGCGYNPRTTASQVYMIDKNKNINENVCLIGTSEIPLTSYHLGTIFDEQLPKRYCCVSRCYRAEVKSISKEAGLYRVPYFTKVEMFALTEKEESNQLLDEFVAIQKYLYSQLELHIRIIDMPPFELGINAYRKYDIQAWLQGTKDWGEISSASNCTDFQSRRFNIRYRKLHLNYETNQPYKIEFVHTVNATACAVPRLMIPLIEQYQLKDKSFSIPQVLQKYMNGQTKITKNETLFLD